MLTEKHLLTLAAARFNDLVYLCVRNKALDSDDIAHSLYDAYDQDEMVYVGKVEWDTVAMAVARKPEEIMLAVSSEGNVYSYVGGRENLEKIPTVRGDIRNLMCVDGVVYACGVRRQVFRRDSAINWIDISAPEPSQNEKRMVGFEAINGFSNTELYAVGWSGDIFRYDGLKWNDIVSPTNNVLTSVACGDNGFAYIVGRNSTFIKGRNDSWEIIDTEGIIDDFWDVHWFNDKVYISSMSRLYEFDGNIFRPVDVGVDRPSTCHKLTSSEGIMWSVGTKDFIKFDGLKWERIV